MAVITGASSGIGMVFAQKLASEYDLLLIARRKDRLDALAAQLTSQHGSVVTVLPCDLTNEDDLAIAADRITSEPKLALLVNNAGFGTQGLFLASRPRKGGADASVTHPGDSPAYPCRAAEHEGEQVRRLSPRDSILSYEASGPR